MAILTVTDLGQALYAELAHGLTNSKNLRKSRHIQNIENLRADIFQHQLTAQFLFCLQQYPQACRRDIGKTFCINGQILTGNNTEQFFFKCSCVDRAHTSVHLNEGITHFRNNVHNIPPDDSHNSYLLSNYIRACVTNLLHDRQRGCIILICHLCGGNLCRYIHNTKVKSI